MIPPCRAHHRRWKFVKRTGEFVLYLCWRQHTARKHPHTLLKSNGSFRCMQSLTFVHMTSLWYASWQPLASTIVIMDDMHLVSWNLNANLTEWDITCIFHENGYVMLCYVIKFSVEAYVPSYSFVSVVECTGCTCSCWLHIWHYAGSVRCVTNTENKHLQPSAAGWW